MCRRLPRTHCRSCRQGRSQPTATTAAGRLGPSRHHQQAAMAAMTAVTLLVVVVVGVARVKVRAAGACAGRGCAGRACAGRGCAGRGCESRLRHPYASCHFARRCGQVRRRRDQMMWRIWTSAGAAADLWCSGPSHSPSRPLAPTHRPPLTCGSAAVFTRLRLSFACSEAAACCGVLPSSFVSFTAELAGLSTRTFRQWSGAGDGACDGLGSPPRPTHVHHVIAHTPTPGMSTSIPGT